MEQTRLKLATENKIHDVSISGLIRALIRENYILKSQVGLLHDMLSERELIDPIEADSRIRKYVAELSESDYLEYLFEMAEANEKSDQVH